MKDFGKFDKLVYIATEADLTLEEVHTEVTNLFPAFKPDQDYFNDKFLREIDIDRYVLQRSLGLSIVEVVTAIGYSATLFSKIFQGEQVSLERLVALAKGEIIARSRNKAYHLDIINKKKDGVASSVTFLEKAYSKQYGDRLALDIEAGFAEAEDLTWNVVVHNVDNKIAQQFQEEHPETEDKDDVAERT